MSRESLLTLALLAGLVVGLPFEPMPSASVSGSASASPSAAASAMVPSIDVSTSSMPMESATVSVSASASASIESLPSASASPSGSVAPSAAPSSGASTAASPHISAAASTAASPDASAAASSAATVLPTASYSPIVVPSDGLASVSVSVSASPSASSYAVESASASSIPSASVSAAVTIFPSASVTPTETHAPVESSSVSASVSVSASGSASPSASISAVVEPSSSVTSTPQPSNIPNVGVQPVVWLHPGSIPVGEARIDEGWAEDELDKWRNAGSAGSALDAVSASSNAYRVPNAINGLSVVEFRASSELVVPFDASKVSTSIFVVARLYQLERASRVVTGRDNRWVMGWDAGREDQAIIGDLVLSMPSTPVTTSWRLYEMVVAADGTVKFYRDGAVLGTTRLPADNMGPAGLRLGGEQTAAAVLRSFAQVAEVIIYDRALGDAERVSLETYLMTRYSLSPPLRSASPSPVAAGASTKSPGDFATTTLWLRPEDVAGVTEIAEWQNAVPGAAPLSGLARVIPNGWNTWNTVRTSQANGPFIFQMDASRSFTLMIVAAARSQQGLLIGNSIDNIAIGMENDLHDVFRLGTSLNGRPQPFPSSSSPFRVFEVVYDSASSHARAFAQGVLIADVVNPTMIGIGILNIGAGEYEIAEVFVLAAAVNSADRLALEGYLFQKFDMQGQLPPSNAFATVSPGFTMRPTGTATASRTPSITVSSTSTPSRTVSPTATQSLGAPSRTASPSSSALPQELPATATFISFDLVIAVSVDVNALTQPNVARDFRSSIANYLGLPVRNVLIQRISNAAGVVIVEFSLSSPLNRVSAGSNRLLVAAEAERALEAAAVPMHMEVRQLQSGGIKVTTQVITSDLAGNAVDPAFTASILARVQAAASNPAAMLGSFIDAQGAALGISRNDLSVDTSSIASGGGAQPTSSPSNATPVGAIVGGVVGALAAIGIVGVIVYFVVFRKQPAPAEVDDFDEPSAVHPLKETLYVTPEGAPSAVPVPSAGPLNVKGVSRARPTDSVAPAK